MTTCDAHHRRPATGGRRALLFLSIAAALAASGPMAHAQTVTLGVYDPTLNDGQVGNTVVATGATMTLTGPQQFMAGQTGGQDTTLQNLSDLGRLIAGQQWIGAARLNPGSATQGVTFKDPITGTNRVASVYNNNNLFALPPIAYSTVVPDIINVGSNQYINMRVGEVDSGGGTLNINVGGGANSQASTNAVTIAAKQTDMFYADGTAGADSNLVWQGQNRITFNGEVADPTQPRNYGVTFVSHFGGTFNTTIGGATTSHTVTTDAQLRDYNSFLIGEIQAGRLDPAQYVTYFALGYTSTTEQITYGITADSPPDDVSQPIGDRIVMRLVGANAHGTIDPGGVLEVVNANGGAVHADAGATFVNNGTLASQRNSGDGSALILTTSSQGANAGVINGNFFRNADGGISSGSFGANIVDVQSTSTFDNAANGIINLALGTTNGAGKSTGIRIGTGASATNDGTVNVGVTGTRSNGSADGIYMNDASGTFTNSATGMIYIGRAPQYTPGATAADIALNQGTITTGINVPTAATVLNAGTITIGTLTQNAAGILVTAPAANVTNAGTINITGKAATVPRENIGISVMNAGATGNISNTGTINVTGVNGTALKVVSTAGTPSLIHSTGTINVAGGADPGSGTRNFGVWVEGQGSATATGDIQGAVNLLGDGAIGIHARGRATVNVAAGAAPSFQSGSKQIGFFAFGDNAKINVGAGAVLDVSTTQSTLFRADSGADFDGTGLTISVSGSQATGVLGTGTGSVLNTRNASIAVTGAGAQGVVAEGGANATIDSATSMTLTGVGAVAGVADGQKHDLTGAATGALSKTTTVNSLATLNSPSAGVIGFIARNSALLSNAGALNFTGANTTGMIVETNAAATNSGSINLSGPAATGAILRTGGTLANTGTIHVGQGTGVRVEGTGTQRLNPAGAITVDDGIAGVQLVSGAGLMLGSGDSAITTNGTAHGVLLDAGATSLVAGGTRITTLGSGNAIENAAETGAITLTGATLHTVNGAGLRTATTIDPASTATFQVDGAGVGYAFRHADGTPTTGDLSVGSGFTINGSGAGSTGIQALTSGAVTTAASVNILSAAGGSALLAGTASSVVNSGSLVSASTVAPVVDLANGTGTAFTNTGTVTAASPAAVAVRGSAGNDTVTLPSGAVRGDIATGEGSDTFRWTGGTLEGGLTMGNGVANSATLGNVDTSTTYHLLAGTGGSNTLTLDGTQARGGTFAADDLDKGIRLVGWNTFHLTGGAAFELTDNLVMAGSDVVIDSGSVLYAGHSVYPVITAATPGTASLTNNGLIDLTNGSGSPGNTLTVDGNYTADEGAVKFITTLDAGGALAAQSTDRLLIQGNASGETVLDITPGALSTGQLTDLNRNGYVGPDEGISVVQVAGTSDGGAFRLNGGYVAFGAHQYGLYAFQPGSSDAAQRAVAGTTSGNAFWDYRLANVLVCDGPCPAPTTASPAPTPAPGEAYVAPPPLTGPLAEADARPALVPQVPASIVSPSALAFFGYRAIDNLHRRLGEVRNMDDMDTGLGGEVFVRYLGGDYHVSTNRSFREYGYDYDMQTRGAQVGANIYDLTTDRFTLRAGVAYTHGTTRLDPKAADGYSHAKLETNAIAALITLQWVNGFYLDLIASGDRHSGDIDTLRAKDATRVRGSGWNGSAEAGYPFRFDGGWELEPQLQLIRQHIGLNNEVDVDHVTTRFEAFEQTIGRAGLRFDRTWTTDGGGRYTPYVRANYVKGWGGVSKVDVGAEGYDFSDQFAGGKFGQMMEFGLGGTYAWRHRLSVYGEADWQNKIGAAGARGWGANLGVRWDF